MNFPLSMLFVLFLFLCIILPTVSRLFQGPYGFWKVMEIDSAIFQELESFGKESSYGNAFKMAIEKFCIWHGKILNHSYFIRNHFISNLVLDSLKFKKLLELQRKR